MGIDGGVDPCSGIYRSSSFVGSTVSPNPAGEIVGVARGFVKLSTPKHIKKFTSRRAAFRQAKRDAGIPTSQTHNTHVKNLKADSLDNKRTATEFKFDNGKTIQYHPAGHKYPDGSVYNKPHFHNHGKGGTKNHYEY